MDIKKLQDKVKQFQKGNEEDANRIIETVDRETREDIKENIAEAKFEHVVIHKINDFFGKIFGWKRNKKS